MDSRFFRRNELMGALIQDRLISFYVEFLMALKRQFSGRRIEPFESRINIGNRE